MMHSMAVARINDQQSALARTQQALSTGKRINAPSDDPIGAASVLTVSGIDAQNTQFSTNRSTAKSTLSEEDGILQGVTELIQNVQAAVVTARNGTLSDKDRGFIAADLRGQLEQLLGLANSRDGAGNYFFSGYQSQTAPFSATGTSAQYSGDSGSRQLQVAAGQQMAVSDSGLDVFQNIRAGNGTFTTAATATNTGSGLVNAGSVVAPASLTQHDYQINFSVAGGVTTYSVLDSTTSTTLSSGNAYTSGNAISFDGMQFNVSGSPANGDQFKVTPSPNQSLFQTMSDLIKVLSTPATGTAATASLHNGLTAAHSALDNALDSILTVRASVGSRLNQLDALDAVGSDLHLQYQQTLSSLQDTDYNLALSTFSQQQLSLEAAQKSFAKVMGLSLFTYL
jgi:flagellar hook-associated protein 3 FlgL